jgi:copper chaperone CopZ
MVSSPGRPDNPAEPGDLAGATARLRARTLTYPISRSQEDDMLASTPRTFIGATAFQVTGMTCGHCQRAVTEEISRIPGIQGVTVDLATGSVTVTATQPVDRTDVAHAVDEAGYTLIP